MRRALLAVLTLAGGLGFILQGAPSEAIRPQGTRLDDPKRFGLNVLSRRTRRGPSPRALAALEDFRRRTDPGWAWRFDPRTGAPSALTHGRSPARRGRPAAAAASFLEESREMLQVEPASLVMEREIRGQGLSHVLYRQTYRGLPVEFSRVKVHLSDDGRVIGANSSFEPDLSLDINPSLGASQAFEEVRRELGPVSPRSRELVVLPLETTGRSHLAWRFMVRHRFNLWRYYIDAHTGQVLLRYDDARNQAPCLTSGTVQSLISEIDPSSTTRVAKHIRHQWVSVAGGQDTAVTNTAGFFCSGVIGKISASLQGPYVQVSNWRGTSAHYDNGSGVWTTVATPVSSPHPYPNNTTLTTTINISAAAPNAVKVLPVFSSFKVGTWSITDGAGDYSDDDWLAVIDSSGNVAGTYLGDRGAFRGAAVNGKVMKIRLKANGEGQNDGFDISVSSYLVLSAPTEWNVAGSSVFWSTANTSTSLRGEINLFYHLNAMHDYFMGDVNKSSASFIDSSINAVAFVGPHHVGAFFLPSEDTIYFGDVNGDAPSDALTDDATVPRHEYTHFLTERIFPIQNFGQAGAISEANADYFSASSLNHSSIGQFFTRSIDPFAPPLRELDCPTKTGCKVLSAATWSGEIHDDSLYIGQALWDLRKKIISDLIPGNLPLARSCADGLAFQTLLFFPESFTEYYDAITRVDREGRVAACPGANSAQALIAAAFGGHGIPGAKGDGYESNDGFMSAVDISTLGVVSASLFPGADIDFYTFAGGPGLVKLELGLPPFGSLFKAYSLTLYNRHHQILASANPVLDGLNTIEGFACENFDCNTTDSVVKIDYSTTSPSHYFVKVHGSPTLGGSDAAVNSAVPYTLTIDAPRVAAVPAGIIAATVDNEFITFSVGVTTFPRTQPYFFAYAQLRDHALKVLPGTKTTDGAGGFLTFVSSDNGHGKISGAARIPTGFAKRFPAVGTVHLEVFAYNPYTILGSTISLGLSQPLNLGSAIAELTAYNNVFNPLEGGKTTIKYEIPRAAEISVKLYTLQGKFIKTLFEGPAVAGRGSVDWNGRNSLGGVVSSGVYVVHMEGLGMSKRQKVVVVK